MDVISYKTVSVSHVKTNKKWVLVDAEGQTLGRLASNVAKILRGKHKPSFTPHVDEGDFVVIINSDKIQLTGDKLNQKVYVRHTGYPGGQRFTKAKDLLKKYPSRVIQFAVKGMLPKNKLGRAIFGNLKVYAGSTHPHIAQQPTLIDITKPETWTVK
jgi:large subunit ribosomal protein L13